MHLPRLAQEAVDYFIVGGGLAGGNAASAIRKKDSRGSIVLVTNEPHIPYDRVPLSKAYLMDKTKRERLFFKKKEYYHENKVRIITERRADSIDTDARTIRLDDGAIFSFGKLLLATGGYPRKIALPGSELQGVYYLRTIDGCEKIKDAITKSKRAVVIGGGFIGCELAAAFAVKGLETTIVEMGSYLLNMAIDEDTGRWIGDYYASKGVKLLLNASASRFIGQNGMISGVETKSGETVEADFAVVGIGITPNTRLAEQAGLTVDKGIVVNEFMESNKQGIFAAGDVARFYSPIFKRHLRLEHHDVAVKHGTVAGANMAGAREAFDELPYFYSYQFDLKIHAYGDLSHRAKIVRRGKLNDKEGFLQFYLDSENTLEAVLSVNRPWEEIREAKDLVRQRKSYSNPDALSDKSRD